jgi:uncharacterized FlgJ-related protein
MKKLFFFVLCLIASTSLSAQRITAEEYINKYKDAAIVEMKRSGVPASITLAQGLLETENGNSDLLQRSNNHFGIKCKSDWKGESVKHTDDAPNECFRKYNSALESYADHSNFLKNSVRYSALFSLEIYDYKGWAQGLKKAGYATNPRYPQILISNIEKYELFLYDRMDGDNNSGHMVDSMARKDAVSIVEDKSEETQSQKTQVVNQGLDRFNGLKAIFAKANTSLLAIASKAGISLSKLLDYNDLDKDGLLPEPQYIYLEKKAKQGKMEKLTLAETTTLREVSQSTGVQLQYLVEYNKLEKSATLPAGTSILLKPSGQP